MKGAPLDVADDKEQFACRLTVLAKCEVQDAKWSIRKVGAEEEKGTGKSGKPASWGTPLTLV